MNWILYSSHASQPLLHEVIWGQRSCDVVTRALQELFQHFITLLECYSPDKVGVVTHGLAFKRKVFFKYPVIVSNIVLIKHLHYSIMS